MQELKLQPGTLPGAKPTHLSRTKERGGNTTEPTQYTEEPIGMTANDTILLSNTWNDTRKPPAATYTYTSYIDVAQSGHTVQW